MPIDLVNAIIQLPFAAILAIVYFREAQRLHERGQHKRRVRGLAVMGSIAGGLFAWRWATVMSWAPPELQPSGEQVTQTLLLVGLGIAYMLLREQPRHT